MITNKSDELFKESVELMPGGVNSPVRAFRSVGRNPLFIDYGKGAYITDVDGNSYIDYVCSWGALILGHAHDQVVEEVKKACEKGLTYGAPTEKESILAKLIREIMPSMEMIRLVNSGTEAVMSAIRLARGYTGRDKIIKFRGCYHGHSDGLLVKAGSGALTQSVPDSLGVPKGYSDNTLVAEYNDSESVRVVFENNKEEIAAIIVEPVAANMGVVPPKEGFLQDLRDMADEYGALLIFDEVITGFRLGLGGAQEFYGIKPDLTTVGKIVGGGMPLAAYGGRRDIMEMIAPIGGVYQAGTLAGNPIATTAGIATLRILKEHPEYYEQMTAHAEILAKTIREKMGDKVWVNQVGSLMSVFFTNQEVYDYETATSSDTEKYAQYFNELLEHGIYTAPSQFEAMFVSAIHNDEDIARTCETINQI